ncbi:MAG: CarD family transcriptional regulator [Spirochaetaceae bacterium]|nr:CarD family transcriptional regulator [Spirochaetaceae bacterium]
MSSQYKTNQHLVYPLLGVGEIREVTERKFKDKQVLYYMIYLEVSDMTVMIPVDKADDLGLRAIVPKEQTLKTLDHLGAAYEPVTADWKMRYQMNLDLLKSGTIMDNATVVRALYHRSKIKELPIQERKLYDSALRILSDEIMYSLDITREESGQLIFSKMEV